MAQVGGRVLIVGDQKGPASYDVPNCTLFTIRQQMKLPFRLARALPTGHYARKNLGYLVAMSDGAECIYETDDDNYPLPAWRPRLLQTPCKRYKEQGWINVYRAFSRRHVWPRGFPLDLLANKQSAVSRPLTTQKAPIQQGLANGSPDVDAIWRLCLGGTVRFRSADSIYLAKGQWCPFNSQSTWWWPSAYPLLYLPSHVSFRMTDIWRSLVAQRCLWANGLGIAFHPAEVQQERNAHSLLRDFADEIPGYLNNQRIAQLLGDLNLTAMDTGGNLIRCYDKLSAEGLVPPSEMSLIKAWLADLSVLMPKFLG